MRRLIALTAVTMVAVLAPDVAHAGGPADVTVTLDVTPTAIEPGQTATATGTFTNLNGPATFRVGFGLEGTNGTGTFTAINPVAGLTNCVIDALNNRSANCDWSPTTPQEQVTFSATISASGEATPGDQYDVSASVEFRGPIVTGTLDIVAPPPVDTDPPPVDTDPPAVVDPPTQPPAQQTPTQGDGGTSPSGQELPSTGNEGWLALLAALLVAVGGGAVWASRRPA